MTEQPTDPDDRPTAWAALHHLRTQTENHYLCDQIAAALTELDGRPAERAQFSTALRGMARRVVDARRYGTAALDASSKRWTDALDRSEQTVAVLRRRIHAARHMLSRSGSTLLAEVVENVLHFGALADGTSVDAVPTAQLDALIERSWRRPSERLPAGSGVADEPGPQPGSCCGHHEVVCPSCGATIRARMADQPAPRTGPTAEQLAELRRTHPVPWKVDGSGYLVDAIGVLVHSEDLRRGPVGQLVADAVNAWTAAAGSEAGR